MEINLEKEKTELIRQNILENENFKGHEDLYNKIFEETIHRGFIILKNADANSTMTKIYIKKIVSTAVEFIINQSEETTSSTKKQNSITKEINSLEHKKNNVATKEETSKNQINKYALSKVEYNFNYTPAISATAVKTQYLQRFYDNVVISNSQNPEKDYLKIYNMRYIQKNSISKIEKELNIPAAKISKILFELMSNVRKGME